jgi:hypothetical protein
MSVDIGSPISLRTARSARSVRSSRSGGTGGPPSSLSNAISFDAFSPTTTPMMQDTMQDGESYYGSGDGVYDTANPPQSVELPAGWAMYYSEEGWPYYYNEYTQESSWEPPAPTPLEHLPDSTEENYQNQTPYAANSPFIDQMYSVDDFESQYHSPRADSMGSLFESQSLSSHQAEFSNWMAEPSGAANVEDQTRGYKGDDRVMNANTRFATNYDSRVIPEHPSSDMFGTPMIELGTPIMTTPFTNMGKLRQSYSFDTPMYKTPYSDMYPNTTTPDAFAGHGNRHSDSPVITLDPLPASSLSPLGGSESASKQEVDRTSSLFTTHDFADIQPKSIDFENVEGPDGDEQRALPPSAAEEDSPGNADIHLGAPDNSGTSIMDPEATWPKVFEDIIGSTESADAQISYPREDADAESDGSKRIVESPANAHESPAVNEVSTADSSQVLENAANPTPSPDRVGSKYDEAFESQTSMERDEVPKIETMNGCEELVRQEWDALFVQESTSTEEPLNIDIPQADYTLSDASGIVAGVSIHSLPTDATACIDNDVANSYLVQSSVGTSESMGDKSHFGFGDVAIDSEVVIESLESGIRDDVEDNLQLFQKETESRDIFSSEDAGLPPPPISDAESDVPEINDNAVESNAQFDPQELDANMYHTGEQTLMNAANQPTDPAGAYIGSLAKYQDGTDTEHSIHTPLKESPVRSKSSKASTPRSRPMSSPLHAQAKAVAVDNINELVRLMAGLRVVVSENCYCVVAGRSGI